MPVSSPDKSSQEKSVSVSGKQTDAAVNGGADFARRRQSRLLRFRIWLRDNVPDVWAVYFMAVVVGAVTGFAAFLLKWLISLVMGLLTAGMDAAGANWILLLYPILGLLLTGIFVRYIIRTDISHGVSRILKHLKSRRYKFKFKATFAPIIGTSITLGCGGSAGAEGPIAYTGAAIGSNFGRFLGFRPEMMYIMIGCGTAAGISGIFRAPIGGFLFTLEVLRMHFSTISVMALLSSSLTAYFVTFLMMGRGLDLPFPGIHNFDESLTWWYIALALFCGLYSLYYSKVMDVMTNKVFNRMKNPWLKNILGGVIISVCVFLFPTLYGEGYGAMGRLLEGDFASLVDGSLLHPFSGTWQLALVAMGIWLCKPFASAAANSAGGVAGDFAPTLFAGAIVGLFFALAINSVFGENLPVTDFAFLGMGAVMAGAVRAPLMAMFITVEMTGCQTLFFPMFFVTAISYCVVRMIATKDFYSLRHRDKTFFGKV